MNVKKIITTNSLLFLAMCSIFCFEWPQKEIKSDTFFTYFAQRRGGQISPSIVFSESEDIKTSGSGYVTAVISEHDEQPSLFESTLGNAVVINHADNLLTVYANLNADEQEERYSLKHVEENTPLGTCGSSGWQEGNALLEFQVIDLKTKSLVNPRLLMPRFGNELPLSITNVTAVNKKGTVFDLNIHRHLSSGTYYLYRDRQNKAMPYKTTILVNGAETDSITYDTLVSKNGKLSTSGKRNYPYELLYPDEKKQLIAEVTIPKGKNKISIAVKDALGKEKILTYTIEAY